MDFERPADSHETIEQRNLRIIGDLDAGMLPVLPFELPILERQLEAVKNEQDEMGKELGEVNHQSSETWHDNFAANQIEWHSRVVSSRGRRLVETLHQAVEYPLAPEGAGATLGSMLELRFRENAPPKQALLTGTVRELGNDDILNLPEDLLIVTLQSPLGRALIGAEAGDSVTYSVDGMPRIAELLAVRQLDLPD